MRRRLAVLIASILLGLTVPGEDLFAHGGPKHGRSSAGHRAAPGARLAQPHAKCSAPRRARHLRHGHHSVSRGFRAPVQPPRRYSARPERNFHAPLPAARPIAGRPYAIDGDTFYSGGVRYRLRNIDTPEKGAPRAEAARVRLQQLLDSGSVTVEPHAIDKYGRTVAIVRVNGTDVADVLRREGFSK